MKTLVSTVLSAVCVLLAVIFVVVKRDDNAQHETDAAAITNYSNRLDLASSAIVVRDGTILNLSNRLDQCQSASLALSNQLTAAIALDADQITNLNRQVAEMTTENQTLSRQVTSFTNQVAGLTQQNTRTEASLARTNQDLMQARKDYSLLENRLRRDVAERVIVERKFNNSSELQAQIEKLKQHPAGEISAESILAGLDVEVNSNGTFHVLASE